MAQYQLAAKVTVSAYTTIEAGSLEEAIKIASSRHVALDGTGELPSTAWIIEDADGSADNIGEA